MGYLIIMIHYDAHKKCIFYFTPTSDTHVFFLLPLSSSLFFIARTSFSIEEQPPQIEGRSLKSLPPAQQLAISEIVVTSGHTIGRSLRSQIRSIVRSRSIILEHRT